MRRAVHYPLPVALPTAQLVSTQVADLERALGTMRREEHRGALYATAAQAVETARAAGAAHCAAMTLASGDAWRAARDAARRAHVEAWCEYADAMNAAVVARGLEDRARCRGAA